MFKEPLKAAKSDNNLFKKNTAESVEYLELTVISRGQFIGEEDMLANQIYHTSVQCVS